MHLIGNNINMYLITINVALVKTSALPHLA